MPPLISVIIPCYNTAPYLIRCLDSLLQQSLPADQFEVILVDNGSTDGSFQIAQKYTYSIRILTEQKRGSYSARNRGLEIAQGKIIAYTDSDCAPSPDWLREIAVQLETPGVYALLGVRRFAANTRSLKLLEAYEIEKAAYICEQGNPAFYYGHTNNMAVRREVCERLGRFEERHRGADTLFIQRIVHHYGCSAVRFDRRMWVEHMEIRSLSDFYGKQWVHGRSNGALMCLSSYRPLTQAARWAVFRRMSESVPSVNRWQALRLLLLLGAGAMIYQAGEHAGKR